MKKLLLSGLLLSLGYTASAQVEIGLQLSPGLSWTRAEGSSDVKVSGDGSKAKFSGGIVVDYFFGDNYAFTTGLMLMSKGGDVKVGFSDPIFGGTSETIEQSLQYIELPIGLKLYTNEVAPDVRVFFKVGGMAGVLTGAKVDGEKQVPDSDEKYSKYYNTLEVSAMAGTGVEYQLGESTKLFGGFTYHHGLSNIDDKKAFGLNDKDITLKNSQITLDIGLKF